MQDFTVYKNSNLIVMNYIYSVTFGQIAVKRKKDVEDAMNYHGKLITKTLLFRKVYYFKNLFMRFT